MDGGSVGGGGLWAQLLNIESREFVWSVVCGGCWEDGGWRRDFALGLPLYLEISFSIYNVNFRIS